MLWKWGCYNNNGNFNWSDWILFFSLQIGNVFLTLWKLGCWHARLGHLLAEDVPGGISQHASQKVCLLQRISCFHCLNCYNSLISITVKNICLSIIYIFVFFGNLQFLAKCDMVWWCNWLYLIPHRFPDLRTWPMIWAGSALMISSPLFLVEEEKTMIKGLGFHLKTWQISWLFLITNSCNETLAGFGP